MTTSTLDIFARLDAETAAIDADLLAAAQECEAATDVYGVTDACDVQNLADKHCVSCWFVAARARALGIPVWS